MLAKSRDQVYQATLDVRKVFCEQAAGFVPAQKLILVDPGIDGTFPAMIEMALARDIKTPFGPATHDSAGYPRIARLHWLRSSATETPLSKDLAQIARTNKKAFSLALLDGLNVTRFRQERCWQARVHLGPLTFQRYSHAMVTRAHVPLVDFIHHMRQSSSSVSLWNMSVL